MMDYNEIANWIIPGYKTLNSVQISRFEKTEAGKIFVQLTLASQKEMQTPQKWWHFLTHSAQEKKAAFKAIIKKNKSAYCQSAMGSDAHHQLVQQITFNLLNHEFPDFKLLDKNQQQDLSNHPYAQKLFFKLLGINDLIVKKEYSLLLHADDYLNLKRASFKEQKKKALIEQKNKKLATWNEYFSTSPDMANFRLSIANQRPFEQRKKAAHDREIAEKHADQLTEFFPLLGYRKLTDVKSMLSHFKTLITAINTHLDDQVIDELEEEHLMDVIFHCLQQLTQNGIVLDLFNNQHAQDLAKKLLNAFNHHTEFNMDKWIETYQTQLYEHMQAQLSLIHGKAWSPHKTALVNEMCASLSYHFKNSKTNKFVGKLADANAFIQATGFSTQNESSYLAILDVYHSFQYIEGIAEAKNIIVALIAPIASLYQEYKDIAFLEKNNYWKLIRILMPILIVVGVIVLTGAVLAPLALPELALTIAIIPALILGFALATLYVNTKNSVYNALRARYYGGQFEIPEFQVNTRLLTLMHNDPILAEKVRELYINELKRCDKLEIKLAKKAKNGALSSEEITLRKQTKEARILLNLEWYDIHSNNDLGTSERQAIIIKRLQQTSNNTAKKLLQTVKDELETLEKATKTVACDFKDTLSNNPHVTNNVDTIKIHCSARFFGQSKSIELKKRTEKLEDLCTQIAQI